MNTTERRGFSLVELLVVIGIITMLIALLLPALLSVWGDAQQLQCKNNIRQHVAAVMQFALKKGRYPGYAATRQVDGGLGAPMTIDVGWAPQLFPYLDMEDRTRDFEERCAVARDPSDPDSPRRWIEHVKLFVCPSDRPDFETTTCGSDPDPQNFVVRFPTSYAVNGGKPDVLNGGRDVRESAIFHDHRKLHDGEQVIGAGPAEVSVKVTDIKDGKGNTILMTENADLVNWTSVTNWPDGSVEFHQAVVISNLYNPTLDPSQHQSNIASAQQDQFPDTSGIGLNHGPIAPDTCGTDTTANKHVQYGQLMSSTLNFRNARPSSFHQDGFVVGYADGRVELFFIENPKSTGDYGRYCREMTPDGRD